MKYLMLLILALPLFAADPSALQRKAAQIDAEQRSKAAQEFHALSAAQRRATVKLNLWIADYHAKYCKSGETLGIDNYGDPECKAPAPQNQAPSQAQPQRGPRPEAPKPEPVKPETK